MSIVATPALLVSPSATAFYETSFPLYEHPISEGGRWLNGETDGVDWHDFYKEFGLAFGTQDERSYSDGIAILKASASPTGSWPDDQEAEATVYTNDTPQPTCYQEVEILLRFHIESESAYGYEALWQSQGGAGYHQIVRWNGDWSDFTYLQQSGTGGVVDGDVVKLTIEGDTIKSYKNGQLQLTATDSTFASGAPGMGHNLGSQAGGCSGSNSDYGFSQYRASYFGYTP